MPIMNAKEVLIVVVLLYGLPVLAEEFSKQSALNYLEQFGHINPGDDRSKSAAVYKKYLRDFQAYTGLPQSGSLDKATVDLMKSPRCGVKDDVGNKRSTSGFYSNSKWDKKELSYRVVKYSGKISDLYVDKICRKAMDLWEGVVDIKLTHKNSGKADIEISFGTGDHGDRRLGCRGKNSFDGPGEETVLAHAFYPKHPSCPEEFGGDVHVDDVEDWSDNFGDGLDLLFTLTHEIGHSLGLKHSEGYKKSKSSPIMQPFYPGWIEHQNFKLHRDDIERIKAKYSKPNTGDFTNTTPNPSSTTCVCDSFTRFDPKRNKDVGNCQTTYRGQKWCYIKKTTKCSDSKSSSTVDNYNWSRVACNNVKPTTTEKPIPTTPAPTPDLDNCVCDSFTRFDPNRNKFVGNCQTTFGGEKWCYIKKTTKCEDSRSSSTVEDYNWSKRACNN